MEAREDHPTTTTTRRLTNSVLSAGQQTAKIARDKRQSRIPFASVCFDCVQRDFLFFVPGDTTQPSGFYFPFSFLYRLCWRGPRVLQRNVCLRFQTSRRTHTSRSFSLEGGFKKIRWILKGFSRAWRRTRPTGRFGFKLLMKLRANERAARVAEPWREKAGSLLHFPFLSLCSPPSPFAWSVGRTKPCIPLRDTLSQERRKALSLNFSMQIMLSRSHNRCWRWWVLFCLKKIAPTVFGRCWGFSLFFLLLVVDTNEKG